MFDLKTVSSLEKVLAKATLDSEEISRLSGLENEAISFQAVFSTDNEGIYNFRLECDGDTECEVYFVKNVAVGYATHKRAYNDKNYISHDPGLYPDLLVPADRSWVYANSIYNSLWITVKARAGLHKIKIIFSNESGETVADSEMLLKTVNAELPEQRLIYTQWFHTDCIADSYGYGIFSEELWSMLEKYLRTAYKNGVNMVLTPVFTPPLDTEVGGERPTVQLVDILKNGDCYKFNFDKLGRWIAMCKKIGFKYFEMPHLFTQWGAGATPKITAAVNGHIEHIFGWDVPFNAPEYETFLSQLLPRLTSYLKEQGVFENTYFHISDEPEEAFLENYRKARSIAVKYLEDCKIIDAVSDFAMYEKSLIDIPVLATDNMKSFKPKKVKERWCYYCNAQCIDVSNRFIAMPSARNRSIGVQLYKLRADGFLHWGYNFYYSRFSKLKLNPLYETDAYGAFPSGDSFSVYPGESGPMPAIGLIVFNEALMQPLSLSRTFSEKK